MGYMAPEIILRDGTHGTPSEWFSLGVCSHEFLLGLRPFDAKKLAGCRDGVDEVRKSEMRLKECEESESLSAAAKDFVSKLLELEVPGRLGTEGGSKSIRSHDFFFGFNFEAIRAQSISAPFLPDVTVANCDTGASDAEEMFGGTGEEKAVFTEEQQDKFEGYGFNTEIS